MTLLNTADRVYVGAAEADRAYLGTTQVWSTWSNYRPVTVNNTGGAAKTNWQVKVTLSSASFDFTDAQSDGGDLQFRATDGVTVLPYWRESYDAGAQTATLWVKVPTVAAGGSATVRLYYGNPLAADTSDGPAVFPSLFEDFTDHAALTTDIASSQVLGNYDRFVPNPFITRTVGTWTEGRLHEVGNIVHCPDDPNPARRYKLYFAARNAALSVPGSVGVAFSPDGFPPFTEHVGNPIISAKEDPHVVLVGGVYHLWCETGSPGSGDIDHYTSSDGVAFTADPANPVIARSNITGRWDKDKVGSPCVVHDGTTFHMVFDANNTALASQNIGVAHSTDGTTWTMEATNPVWVATDTSGSPGNVVPSELYLADDGVTWVVLFHDGGDNAHAMTTTDPPAAWDADSFTEVPNGQYAKHQDCTIHPSGTAMVWEPDSGTGLWLSDILGSPTRTFYRRGGLLREAKIEAHSGQMQITPSGGTSGIEQASMLAFDAGLTSDFAVMTRMSKVDQSGATRDLYTKLGVGSGAVVDMTAQVMSPVLDNGWTIEFHDEGGTANRLYRVTSAVTTQVGSNTTLSGYATPAVYELRVRSTGAISWTKNGTAQASGTDSTHLAAAKDVFITQGHRNATFPGSKSTWEWIAARKFDGVDPTTTVGAEVPV